MSLSISRIAELTSAILTGNANLEILKLAKIEDAVAGDLTFLQQSSYQKYFPATKATAIFVKEGFEKSRDDIVYLEVKDPNKAFLSILQQFFLPVFRLEGIAQSAKIAENTVIGSNVSIGENVVIEAGCSIGNNSKIYHNTVILRDSTIGNNCLIFQNVSIREQTVVGNNVILHPGVVLGSDGFGYTPDEKGVYTKIPQIGNVILEDDVEIGANTTIDRAALGSTIVKHGTKVDNLVQIGHNVSVGSDTVISGQAGVSGSSKIGNNVIIAGQVGIAGHVEIADKAILAAQSGISKSITKSGIYSGYPAKEHSKALRLEGHIRTLPEYAERIKTLEKKIALLEKSISPINE